MGFGSVWCVVSVVVWTALACGQDPGFSVTPTVTSSIETCWTEAVTLTTPLGTVEGKKKLTLGTHPINKHFYAFRGIPYAEPPVGILRWADPVDLKGRWPEGYLNATHYSSCCPQFDTRTNQVLGSEDCLYLNVFTPFLPGSSKAKGREGLLPVLVFIHGGSFMYGVSSQQGPTRLLAHDVVLVTLNYRLSALGYLTTEDETLPGNYGILDMVSALRWVQANVAHFGGDPARVTLGGNSAGATSVHILMVSPLAKGLFHGAIMMSGVANCAFPLNFKRKQYSMDLAERLGCPSSPSSALKTCLTTVPTTDLITAQAAMHRYIIWPLPFAPVVDAGLRLKPVLPGSLASLEPSPLPVLMGMVPHEGFCFAIFSLLMAKEPMNATSVYEELMPYVLSIWPTENYKQLMLDTIEAFYFTQEAKTSLNVLLEQMTEAMTDHSFGRCIWNCASSLANDGLQVYMYLYSHRGSEATSLLGHEFQRLRQLGITSTLLTEAVSHSDEKAFLFDVPYFKGKLSSTDQTVSDLLTAMWTNFVATGSPQRPDDITSDLPPWTPVRANQGTVDYYNLSLTPTMVYTPYRQKDISGDDLVVCRYIGEVSNNDCVSSKVSWRTGTCHVRCSAEPGRVK